MEPGGELRPLHETLKPKARAASRKGLVPRTVAPWGSKQTCAHRQCPLHSLYGAGWPGRVPPRTKSITARETEGRKTLGPTQGRPETAAEAKRALGREREISRYLCSGWRCPGLRKGTSALPARGKGSRKIRTPRKAVAAAGWCGQELPVHPGRIRGFAGRAHLVVLGVVLETLDDIGDRFALVADLVHGCEEREPGGG